MIFFFFIKAFNDWTVAADIDEALLHTVSRDDLRDLFPGPKHFFRRKRVWALINSEVVGYPLCSKLPGTTWFLIESVV